MLVTCAIEVNLPLSRRGDLDRTRQLLVVRDRVAAWADSYGLPEKLIVHPSQQALIPNNPAAKAQVFQAYVGGLFKEQGYFCVEEWFAPVVDDALCEIQEFEIHDLLLEAALEDRSDSKSWRKKNDDSPETGTLAVEPVLPIACPPKPGEAQPRAGEIGTGPTGATALSFFNETYAKKLKGTEPNWQTTKTGPSHAPEFTTILSMPGSLEPVGIGIGTTLKLAKQQAASQALTTLGWVRPI
jgi:dsRNA-specific ribonuclease